MRPELYLLAEVDGYEDAHAAALELVGARLATMSTRFAHFDDALAIYRQVVPETLSRDDLALVVECLAEIAADAARTASGAMNVATGALAGAPSCDFSAADVVDTIRQRRTP